MFDIRSLNISIEIWCILFCTVGIVCSVVLRQAEDRYRNTFIAAYIIVLVAAGGDALAGVYRGQTGSFAWAATHIGNFATFTGSFLLLFVFTSYLCARLREAGGGTYDPWRICVGAATALMCLFTLLGAFYTIDEANVYSRQPLYWTGLALVILINLVNLALVVYNRQRLSTAMFACMLIYTITPIVASIPQAIAYGVNFIIAAELLGLAMLFFELQMHSANVLNERTERLARSEVELSESRIAVMVSQIQPHFLFNTLDSIYVLCDEDVERAKRAIDEFSQFLRTNLNSLKQMQPVSIESELEHVKVYLELEKLSMEDLLEYEIDRQAGGFMVPALSVQTLAENAVKHGVAKRPEGGTVRVRTREQPDCYLVSIVDDGVGFKEDSPKSGEEGIGIENTRARLAAMCSGTLEVNSTPGVGTTVIMKIPK